VGTSPTSHLGTWWLYLDRNADVEEKHFGLFAGRERHGGLGGDSDAVPGAEYVVVDFHLSLDDVEPSAPSGGKLIDHVLAFEQESRIHHGVQVDVQRSSPSVG
jgi:hypothetical protein